MGLGFDWKADNATTPSIFTAKMRAAGKSFIRRASSGSLILTFRNALLSRTPRARAQRAKARIKAWSGVPKTRPASSHSASVYSSMLLPAVYSVVSHDLRNRL